jgi:hypothetical protein
MIGLIGFMVMDFVNQHFEVPHCRIHGYQPVEINHDYYSACSKFMAQGYSKVSQSVNAQLF